MAEKEERILIKKQINYHPPYGGWCGEGKEIVLTRQEAIERMAKAVCMSAMYGCERCSFGKDKEKCEEWIAFNHIQDAEAALNALLED